MCGGASLYSTAPLRRQRLRHNHKMPRTARLALLAILFLLVTALQLRLAWSTIVFVQDPGATHDWLPVSLGLIVHRPQGGLEKGDHLLSVSGVAVASRAASYRAIKQHPLKARVDVEVERAGHRITTWTTAEPRKTKLGWIGKLSVVIANILTPGFCLLLGFFVVYRRPEDPLAWWVLLALAAQSHYNSFRFVVDGWPPFWSGLMRFFGGLTALGLAGWLWFGFDFPERHSPRKLLPFLRWPLTAGLLYLTVMQCLSDIVPELPAAQAPAQAMYNVLPAFMWLALARVPIMLGWANLVYKLRGETRPDERRRLRLLVWGLLVGRGPLLAAEIGTQFTGFNLLNSDRFVVPATVIMMLLFLVPATLAYVLVVQRAMDVGVVVRQGLQYAFARRSVEIVRLVLAGNMILVLVNLSFDSSLGRGMRLLALSAFVLAILLMEPASRWLRAWVDRRFFREAVHGENLLSDLTDQLRTLAAPDHVLASLTERIRQALHVERVDAWLDRQVPPAVAERVRAGATLIATDEPNEWLRAAEAELVLPIAPRQQLLGILTLGPKRSEEPYSDRDIRLLESVTHQAGLALENAQLASTVAQQAAQRERLHRELEIAREVQTRLLPKHEPVIPGLETAGLCRPAQSIGGDYYDYPLLPNGSFALAIGDVAGKGVPAALLMSNLQAALRGLTASSTLDVPALTSQLNQLVYDSTPANRFITFLYSVYEPATRRWTCCTAGHNPAALLRAGSTEVEWLRTKGLGLGLKRNARFEQLERTLASGDLLLLYTDGLTEALNPAGEDFGEERLAAGLVRHRTLPVTALRDALVSDVDAFAGEAPQHDDMTIIVVRASSV